MPLSLISSFDLINQMGGVWGEGMGEGKHLQYDNIVLLKVAVETLSHSEGLSRWAAPCECSQKTEKVEKACEQPISLIQSATDQP